MASDMDCVVTMTTAKVTSLPLNANSPANTICIRQRKSIVNHMATSRFFPLMVYIDGTFLIGTGENQLYRDVASLMFIEVLVGYTNDCRSP